MTHNNGWAFIPHIKAEDFILKMLEYGPPIQTSIVGSFDTEGRGSRRDIPLPLHRDGDYSTEYKGKISWIGLFCLKAGGTAQTLILDNNNNLSKIKLENNQAIIINNKQCMHGRNGTVKNRLLLRIWI